MTVKELAQHLSKLSHQDAQVELFIGEKKEPGGTATGPTYELGELLSPEAECGPDIGDGYPVLEVGEMTDRNIVTLTFRLRAQFEGSYVLDVSAEKLL